LPKTKSLIAKSRKKLVSEKKAISTIYASVVALLIVFLLLPLLALYFNNYNAVLQNQMKTSEQKTQEALLIADATVSQDVITDVKVQNTGTIAIKIRALYSKNNVTTSFVSDPSIYISSGDTCEIPTNITYNPSVSLFVATEQGTLSKEYFVHKWETTGYIYDTENLDIGYVRLRFESFYYSARNATVWGSWKPGWNPPTGSYVRWKISVTNIGDKVIKLNNGTAFTLWAGSNNEIPWYIDTQEKVLPINETVEIVFLVNKPGLPGTSQSDWQQTPTSSTSMMVFLTFLGKVVLSPGNETSYGQTIPFEAVVPGA
jgi:hypothetical protein